MPTICLRPTALLRVGSYVCATTWMAGLCAPVHAQSTIAAAQMDSTAPRVTWFPAAASQGSLTYIVVRLPGALSDSAVTLSGILAEEQLHFDREPDGTFRAIGAIPVGTGREVEIPLTVTRAGEVDQHLSLRLPVLRRRFGVERLKVAPQFTTPPDSALAQRIAHEAELAREVAVQSHHTPKLWSLPFERPRDSQITSRFGTGREFNGVIQSRHLGIDFRGEVGAPIQAANDGVVALVGDFYYSGRIVYVDHGRGLVTAYLHMSETLVAAGDTVHRGQVIGRVGSSGRVTGPHLHWNVRYGLISVDPFSLLALDQPPAAVAADSSATQPPPPPTVRPVAAPRATSLRIGAPTPGSSAH